MFDLDEMVNVRQPDKVSSWPYTELSYRLSYGGDVLFVDGVRLHEEVDTH